MNMFSSSVCELFGAQSVKPILQLRFDYDMNDTTTHLTTTEVIEIIICVRFDCNTTTTRLWQKIDVHFLLVSNRIKWKQACAIHR